LYERFEEALVADNLEAVGRLREEIEAQQASLARSH